ncbi:hypothetical protein AB3S75_002902 [Citrus x aurantiifolia]
MILKSLMPKTKGLVTLSTDRHLPRSLTWRRVEALLSTLLSLHVAHLAIIEALPDWLVLVSGLVEHGRRGARK